MVRGKEIKEHTRTIIYGIVPSFLSFCVIEQRHPDHFNWKAAFWQNAMGIPLA